MFKVVLVMHDGENEYYRMNKVYFENMPIAGQYIYNSDGLAYRVEEVASFAGYVSEKGATTILVVHPVDKNEPVSDIYGLDIERDLDD
ncbi:LysR family transcriptional regulator [Lactobacillus sp. UCMA15818]|uniref:LysR family transcriptional regulator n=1 Tax=Lactobacillaceae TaxID=33958 RepID=UPI0025B1C42D|nr:LysR family transcriptional regulator [Lactobacillus sp. UCMA15818]MDN2452427.1 LysR family transcriptional regulator [Lactobacillus sp. UCMA15818]